MSKIHKPSAYRYDKKGNLRLVVKPILFSEFCELIFCRIQPYVCKDRNATFHLMTMMSSIHKSIINQEHKSIIRNHATSLKNAAEENLFIKEDRKKLLFLYQLHFT